MNPLTWFTSLLHDNVPTTHAMLPKLKELAATCDRIAAEVNSGRQDGVQVITGFCAAVAEVQDIRLVGMIQELSKHGRYARLMPLLDQLNTALTNAGRDLNGVNRTDKGQAVTDEYVYLGKGDGLETFTVSQIKSRRADCAFYLAMCVQADRYMGAQMSPILRLIHSLQQGLMGKAL